MTPRDLIPTNPAGRAVALAIVACGAIGFAAARLTAPDAASTTLPAGTPGKVLYYYDPMVPAQHFDKPGKSPFMDMELVARYAEGGNAAGDAGREPPGVGVDPAAVQSLGIRLATVERGTLASDLTVTGSLDFNQRDVAIVQARAGGFVQRVYARAPGDVIAAGAPLADMLVPEWGGAQVEYQAVRRTGDAALIAAARDRLRLLGAGGPGGRGMTTIRAPIGGVIQTLEVRAGMTLASGQTLAQISGLGTIWLNAAVPEAQAGLLRVGRPVRAELTAFPGENVAGRVVAILPTAQIDSRTLTVRIELPNPGRRLRPGMFATVHIGGEGSSGLLVPSEAVIRTGKRVLVMVAGAAGLYRPVEVRIGREGGGRTEILAGLVQGEKVVASGQFLLDSEANLSGIDARPLGGDAMTRAGARR
ncbi:efflux RND transporter periplasmic adaptor subunit [Sphingomonas sp. AR_OL41]|uniref:efflux RND transporter periplasmic adaptor subunit n=1 Tax=Sphingomonas sp. AR_OL41 TaxID=3042729 RepID=UPI00248067BF|nr:efflux RND transporter periplasmic adaptor subunit [Sphingomonas sp. AR_OL41]MDH7971566.1 efflux RND transporter periplasmic adaptor subunit [Sphingomonas sp. AR_OL41]